MSKSIFLSLILAASSNNVCYKQITENRPDWAGEYVIVYEDKVFNCIESVSNYAVNNEAYPVSIEKYNEGYSIKILTGENENKYMYDTASENALKFANLLSKVENQISFNDDYTFNIVSGGNTLRFNKTKGQDRFRYYKDTSTTLKYPLPNLYIKYDIREWEKDFFSNFICDASGETKPDESVWNELADNYTYACDKDMISYEAEERYSYVVWKYGYKDFMNLGVMKRAAKISFLEEQNTTDITVTTGLGGTGLLAFILYKKKRMIAK